MSDLSIATQQYFNKTFAKQVGLRMPLFAAMMAEKRLIAGGTEMVEDLIVDEATDEVQAYVPGEGMTDGQSEFLDQASWKWKQYQEPMSYDCTVQLQNQLATSEVKRHDLVKLINERAQDGFKRKIEKDLHTSGSTDSGKVLQSVLDGCDHGRTYGTLTSSTSVKTWWNGASYSGAMNDRATGRTIGLDFIRTIRPILLRYVNEGDALYCFLPEALHSKMQGICEGSVYYERSNSQNSKLFNYGLKDTFKVYDVEFVRDSYMTLNSLTACLLILNMSTWKFCIHPAENFKVTPFEWQGKVAGGKNRMLGRILLSCNNYTNKPRANYWSSSAS